MGSMAPIIPAALVSAVSVVNGAIASVKNARDIAKQSSDSALKDAVSEAYDAVLELKDRVLELDEENRELKKELAKKASLRRDSKTGYYFKDGEPDSPICKKCYEGSGKVAYLDQRFQDAITHSWSRFCVQCTHTYYE